MAQPLGRLKIEKKVFSLLSLTRLVGQESEMTFHVLAKDQQGRGTAIFRDIFIY